MGHLGNPGHPDVQATIKVAAAMCQEAGKPAGFLTANEEQAQQALEWGYTYVALGSDMSLLTSHSTALLGRFRDIVTKLPAK